MANLLNFQVAIKEITATYFVKEQYSVSVSKYLSRKF